MWTLLLACRPDPIHPTSPSESADSSGSVPTPTATPTPTGDAALVLPEASGLELLDRSGARAWYAGWVDLLGADCGQCGGEGASVDGDALLLAYTHDGPIGQGGVARIHADGAEWRREPFQFPHDAVRAPWGGIAVAETMANRIAWLDDDGAEIGSLDESVDGFPGGGPNGLDLLEAGGTSLLVVSHHDIGRITCWDVTTAEATLVWSYPATGALATPHGAQLRQVDGQWWLVYAHTDGGGDDGGTIGLAVLAEPAAAPAYVADLTPATRFPFVRGVDLEADGGLWIVDSGSPGQHDGRLLVGSLPDPTPSGASGARGDQTFADLDATELRSDLDYPFEGWWWSGAWR